MSITIFNTLKGRLQSVDLEFSDKNTTWFDDYEVYMITDMDGGILISARGYDYPAWFDGISRAYVGYDKHKVTDLKIHTPGRRSAQDPAPARDGRQLRSP